MHCNFHVEVYGHTWHTHERRRKQQRFHFLTITNTSFSTSLLSGVSYRLVFCRLCGSLFNLFLFVMTLNSTLALLFVQVQKGRKKEESVCWLPKTATRLHKMVESGPNAVAEGNWPTITVEP